MNLGLPAHPHGWKRSKRRSLTFRRKDFRTSNSAYIGTYMADARSAALPLVGSEESDWTILFGQWGLLAEDQKIGTIMRTLGWLGMLATMIWVVNRVRHGEASKPPWPS